MLRIVKVGRISCDICPKGAGNYFTANLIKINKNIRLTLSYTDFYLKMSTAERALIDILQDRRYWIIHSITIPSLFVGGVIFMLSGFVYKLFGALNFNKYFDKDNSSISLIKDRFSICSSMDDI